MTPARILWILWPMRYPLVTPLALLVAGASLLLAASSSPARAADSQAATNQATRYPATGTIERLDPALDQLIAPGISMEKLAEGFAWSEGPVWLPAEGGVVFSDVPRNVVYLWRDGGGLREYLRPSGFTGAPGRGGESGSNGLTLDARGRLVLCQHGDRRIARLEADGSFKTLARYHQMRRFNSPNDLVFKSNGDLYFTDPPYGLEQGNDDPNKELLFSGVYRLSTNGTVTLLTDKLTFPNGIAFSPDERTLYVAVSDSQRPIIMAYPVKGDGSLGAGKVFFDASALAKESQGMPDGMKVDAAGNVWATGPGGILVISPDGKLLGRLKTGVPTANCAWGDDGSTLYITANDTLCRVRTLTKGAGR